eukprot:14368061-Alexandrium_andersonii.AAC.1
MCLLLSVWALAERSGGRPVRAARSPVGVQPRRRRAACRAVLGPRGDAVSYTHLRAHETSAHL